MNATFLLGILGQVLANPFVVTALTVVAGALIAAWLLAMAWAFRQMTRRTDSLLARYLAAAFVFLSGPVLVPISVAVVALVRPHETTGERRIARLLQTVRNRAQLAAACHGCGREMDERWVRCPDCATWTGHQCARCDRWAPAEAEICPWCTWAPDDSAEDLPAAHVPAALSPRHERTPVALGPLREGMVTMADAVRAPRSA